MATTRSTLGHDKIKRTCKIHHVDSTDYFTIWKTLVFSISQFKDQFDTDKLLSHKSLLSCKNENHLRKTQCFEKDHFILLPIICPQKYESFLKLIL